MIFSDEQITIDSKTIRFRDQTVPTSSLSGVEIPKKSGSGCIVTGFGVVGVVALLAWGSRGMYLAESIAVCLVIVGWGLWLQRTSTTQTITAQIGLQWMVIYRSKDSAKVNAVHQALLTVLNARL